ncbi:MAG: hypothetical protein A2932_02050 [Candidatus Spechtbacteria bacterium RIFCSPLOWO2_01_FULL_46_10]|uniref:Peptidase C45 hydrolase domain-containing protein n=1 Tax=Candidatus Spechtbacteria bacterium RIFCSPLOWO2_01_FULL_46_10 TaxID=1802163 RepID=A0A1G2HHC3_9BACT|nr:MAG: hypothetical protein A2932_02050 [Candidatus Spechtbacteria bacterium RIFCSPLOWO2_01_FULL_46_10]
MNHIPYIQIRAKDNFNFGLQLGKILSRQIRRRIRDNKILYKKERLKDFPDLVEEAKKFLPGINKYYPELLAELEGMSFGARVNVNELLVLMCEEELLDFGTTHCTNVALRTEEGVILGHNEDWLPAYKNNGLFVVKGQIKKHKFLSLSYIGGLSGTSCGMNKNLCYTANSLDSGRFRYGVPVKFQMRALLGANTEQEVSKIDLKDSTIATNMVYAWGESRILDIEDFFGHHEKFYGAKFLVHTNHPVLKKDRTKINTQGESIARYNRAKEILLQKQKYDINTLKTILSDHVKDICGHLDKQRSSNSITIASVIMNPRKKCMEICWSNPCRNEYKSYKL